MDSESTVLNSVKKKAIGRAAKPQNIWAIFPEWDNASGSEPKNLKSRFEDPDISFIDAPLRSLHKEFSWRIPSEFYKDKILIRDEELEISSIQLLSENIKHPWIQSLMASFQYILSNKQSANEESFLWRAIFPKSKENPKRIPTANSGRYAVRLHLAGCWRRVVVDDRIPLTDAGDVLFQIDYGTPELWPIILAKAILKVEVILFGDKILKNPGEMDYFAVHTLTGWFPGLVTTLQLDPIPESTPETELPTSLPLAILGTFPLEEDSENTRAVFHKVEDTCILKVDGKLSQEWNYALIDAQEDTFFLICITSYPGEEVMPPREEPHSARAPINIETSPRVNDESVPYFEIELFKWDSPPSSIYPVSQLKPVTSSTRSILLSPSSTITTKVFKVPSGKHLIRFTAKPNHQNLLYLSFHGQKLTAVMEDYVKLLKRLDLAVFEAEGIFKPTEMNTWSLIFKYSLTVGEPITFASYFQVSEDIGTSLRFINNDTNQEEQNQLPQLLSPNTKGYALLADCIVQTKSQLKWRLILATEKGKNNKPHFDVLNEPVKTITEQTGVYTPNKYFQLFRKTIKVTEKTKAALQLTCSIKDGISLFLETFNNGEVTQEVRGQGICQISDTIFLPPPKKDKQSYVVQGRIQIHSPEINLNEEETKLSWKIRIISATALAIKNDTEKEDRQAAIKASWESSQPGRAAKAKKAREKYIASSKQNIMASVIKLTPDMPSRPLAIAYQRLIDSSKIAESSKEKEKYVVELETLRKTFAELQTRASTFRKSFYVQKKGNTNKTQ